MTLPLPMIHHPISFETPSFHSTPASKFHPVIIGGAIFVGKAIVGGAIGSAASWGTTRFLNSRFPSS
jgi:hypothetical protein